MRSDIIKRGFDRAPHRSLLRATGVTDDDFRKPYVLRGAVRSYNQDQLEHSSIDEQMIFYCPADDIGHWHFFDGRTYRSGRLNDHYFISEMEKLL